jgi:Heat induced stress protein YflT domain
MKQTITGLYDSYDDAAQTVRDLAASGIPDADVSLVANNVDNLYVVKEESDATPAFETGAAVGLMAGGSAGLLASLGLLAIPGVGPVVAAGWLVATAVGAGVGAGAGAVTGGVIGSLTGAGVSPEDAQVYAEGVRRGGTLVTARVDEGQRVAAKAIMRRNRSVEPDIRARSYRDDGWNGFDEAAAPLTAAELELERERERERERARDLLPIA